MQSWWLENWWAIPLWLFGIVIMVKTVVTARRDPDARASKVLFWFYPGLDPRKPKRATNHWLLLIALVYVIVMAVISWGEQ